MIFEDPGGDPWALYAPRGGAGGPPGVSGSPPGRSGDHFSRQVPQKVEHFAFSRFSFDFTDFPPHVLAQTAGRRKVGRADFS